MPVHGKKKKKVQMNFHNFALEVTCYCFNMHILQIIFKKFYDVEF